MTTRISSPPVASSSTSIIGLWLCCLPGLVFKCIPRGTVGLESTASFTVYDQNGRLGLNNNDAYTVGPYVTFQPDPFFTFTARGGFTTYQFQNTSTNIQTSNQNTWYAAVSINHQPRDSISYALMPDTRSRSVLSRTWGKIGTFDRTLTGRSSRAWTSTPPFFLNTATPAWEAREACPELPTKFMTGMVAR